MISEKKLIIPKQARAFVIKNSTTEDQIKNTAKTVFFKEGRFNATTQDIADSASVARTLVHYYFRSKEVLFKKVVMQAMQTIDERLDLLYTDTESFTVKIEKFTDAFLTEAIAYPYLETYLVSQMNQHSSGTDTMDFDLKNKKVTAFFYEVESEMKKGTIAPNQPVQFLLNLVSLISYPVIMQPLFKKMLNLTDAQFAGILQERKSIIMKLLLNKNFLPPV